MLDPFHLQKANKLLKVYVNAVSTCTAAVHIFQILYARQFFRRILSRAFTLIKVIIKQK